MQNSGPEAAPPMPIPNPAELQPPLYHGTTAVEEYVDMPPADANPFNPDTDNPDFKKASELETTASHKETEPFAEEIMEAEMSFVRTVGVLTVGKTLARKGLGKLFHAAGLGFLNARSALREKAAGFAERRFQSKNAWALRESAKARDRVIDAKANRNSRVMETHARLLDSATDQLKAPLSYKLAASLGLTENIGSRRVSAKAQNAEAIKQAPGEILSQAAADAKARGDWRGYNKALEEMAEQAGNNLIGGMSKASINAEVAQIDDKLDQVKVGSADVATTSLQTAKQEAADKRATELAEAQQQKERRMRTLEDSLSDRYLATPAVLELKQQIDGRLDAAVERWLRTQPPGTRPDKMPRDQLNLIRKGVTDHFVKEYLGDNKVPARLANQLRELVRLSPEGIEQAGDARLVERLERFKSQLAPEAVLNLKTSLQEKGLTKVMQGRAVLSGKMIAEHFGVSEAEVAKGAIPAIVLEELRARLGMDAATLKTHVDKRIPLASIAMHRRRQQRKLERASEAIRRLKAS